MRNRKLLIAAVVALIVAVAGWYWFRPELLFVNHRVSETPPQSADHSSADGSKILATGEFHTVNHKSKGTATIYRMADGERVLRFTDFETSNGPALYVYLVAAPDATDSKTVSDAKTLDLGELKGNIGDQNYKLPTDVDLSAFHSVTIWCKRFSVNFATAPLSFRDMTTAKAR